MLLTELAPDDLHQIIKINALNGKGQAWVFR